MFPNNHAVETGAGGDPDPGKTLWAELEKQLTYSTFSVKWDSESKKRCKFFALKFDFGKTGFSLQPASTKLKMGFWKTHLTVKTIIK